MQPSPDTRAFLFVFAVKKEISNNFLDQMASISWLGSLLLRLFDPNDEVDVGEKTRLAIMPDQPTMLCNEFEVLFSLLYDFATGLAGKSCCKVGASTLLRRSGGSAGQRRRCAMPGKGVR